MIAVDTNLLVYAHRKDLAWHDPALRVLIRLAEGSAPWAIPWPVVHEFVAITTHPRIFVPPTPLPVAIDAIRTWIATPHCRLIGEGPGYFELLATLAVDHKVSGHLVHDLRIVAIGLHNGVSELWSADRDFSRFPDLKVVNPLAVG
jgi:toxin-antitoxin system PIN domain toxin